MKALSDIVNDQGVSAFASGAASIRKTWRTRITLYPDNRWISVSDTNFGFDDTNATESAGTGSDPIVEWENMGEPVKKNDYLDKIEIRSRTNNTEVTDVEIAIMFVRPDPISRWDTGFDNDDEIASEQIYRDLWVNNSQGVMSHPTNDTGRRVLSLNYTVPEDGEIRIFYKPIGSVTANRFFYPAHILTMTPA